jgi:hypothetical protein
MRQLIHPLEFRLPTSLFFFACMAFLGVSPVAAAQDEAVIEALKEQVRELSARIEALEAKRRIPESTYTEPTVRSAPAPAPASWTEKIKMKGDFRYRHEGFEIEDRSDRHRQRVRARASLTGQVNDAVEVGFGLASGGSDPISTNQTLDDASSSKNVVIDLAYAKWSTPIEGLDFTAGKFKNPFHRAGGNGLIFDGDLNPEGIGFAYENGAMFANALASWVDESSSDDDSFLVGGQFGTAHRIGDGELLAGLSYYNVIDARGEPAFFDGDPQGNRLQPDGTYVSGFEMLEGFVEYAFEIDGRMVTVFADYVHNLEADDYDTGYAVGAKMKSNDWQFGWAYQDLEADAVLGTFTDSDFIGGGTDGKGHILQTSYALSKGISLKGTLFLNDRNVDFGSEEDFKRLMLDVSFKY